MAELDPREVMAHQGDPEALEVLQIKAWAEELAAIANTWLTQREAYRVHQSEQASARQASAHRAITNEIRRSR